MRLETPGKTPAVVMAGTPAAAAAAAAARADCERGSRGD
jgi:hypothetical protein